MLLTLSAKSVCLPASAGSGTVKVRDLPSFVRNELGLHGLTIQTSLLTGADGPTIDKLRDDADKVAVPCLVLVEEQPQPFASHDESLFLGAVDRAERVIKVAHRLGCSSVVFSIATPKAETSVDAIATRMKAVLAKAERLELNLLLAPTAGVTETPEQLTTLIRKVGGFRIGSYPDFESASKSKDIAAYLRGLTPYASAVCAAMKDFDAKGKHPDYNFTACLDAIDSVGFEATLALEFRGKGDALASLKAAKALIEARLSDEPPAELEEEPAEDEA